MGRNKSTISLTQRNTVLMGKIKAQIERYGISQFTRDSGMSRQIIYRWLEGGAVEESTETAILKTLYDVGVTLVKEGVDIQVASSQARTLHAASC